MRDLAQSYLNDYQNEYMRLSVDTIGTKELSYRYLISNFLRNIIEEVNTNPAVKVVDEPSGTGQGRPDFAIYNMDTFAIYSFIEVKPVSENFIDVSKYKKQIDKYLKLETTLILTDGLDFLFLSAESGFVQKRVSLIENKKLFLTGGLLSVHEKSAVELGDGFSTLLLHYKPRIVSEKRLMISLARRAKYIKDDFIELFKSEPSAYAVKQIKTNIENLFGMFRNYLLPGLDTDTFSSLASQLMIFSLFVTFLEENDNKDARTVNYISKLAKTDIRPIMALSGILDNAKSDFGPITIGWHSAMSLLINSRVKESMLDYHKLYEEFYDEFDHSERIKLGAYYTHKEIADYMVELTTSLFEKNYGVYIFDENVKIVDPGAGTGTFMESFLERFFASSKYTNMACELFGIEIAVTPYVLGQRRLRKILANVPEGKQIEKKPKLILGNSLSDDMVTSSLFTEGKSAKNNNRYIDMLQEEFIDAHKATKEPIVIVIGNPPSSDNKKNEKEKFEAIEEEIEKIRPKHRPGRSNIQKQLHNDFVKFIMWACKKIDSTEGGIVSYVVPSAIMANRTYTELRKYLYKFFDEIYVLEFDKDLRNKTNGGNNIFNTLQGRILLVMVRKKESSNNLVPLEKRDDALLYLHSITDIPKEERIRIFIESKNKPLEIFRNVIPEKNNYLFSSRIDSGDLLFVFNNKFSCINDIYKGSESGIKTGSTPLFVDINADILTDKLTDFQNEQISDEKIIEKHLQGKSQKKVGEYSRGWKRAYVAREIKKLKNLSEHIYAYDFRPFMVASILYAPDAMREASKSNGARPRKELFSLYHRDGYCKGGSMLALAKDLMNISEKENLEIFSITVRNLPDNDLATRGSIRLFPNCRKNMSGELESNLFQKSIDRIKVFYSESISIPGGDMAYYINGVLSSKYYRDDFSKIIGMNLGNSEIRIPLTDNKKVFFGFVRIGKEIEKIYYGDTNDNENKQEFPTNFHLVKIKYDHQRSKLIFFEPNKNIFEINLDSKIFNFKMMGYKVLDTFIKYKKYKYIKSSMSEGDWIEVFTLIKKIHRLLIITESDETKALYLKLKKEW